MQPTLRFAQGPSGALAALAALLAAGAGAACGSGGGHQPRSGDAGPAVVVVSRTAHGVSLADEKEPDDLPGQAQALALPGGVWGKIGAAGDVDTYTVAIAQPGTLTVRLEGAADADLQLDVQDAAGERRARSDNGPAGALEGFPNLSALPGTVRLVVREYVKKPKKGAAPGTRTAPSLPYTLTVSLGPKPAAGEEVEPNDQAAFAGELALGGSARGFAGWRLDKDVWKVPLAAIGEDEALTVDVDGVPGVPLRVGVLDGTEAVLLERQGLAGEPVSLKNVAVRAGEPHYYVVIAATRGNLEHPYTVRAGAEAFQLDEEAEPNDSPAAASPLSDVPRADGGTRVGFLGRGDVDLFRLEPAPGARILRLTLEPPAEVDPVLAVVTEAGQPLATPADVRGRGKTEHLDDVAVAPGAVVFVKVTAKAGGSGAVRYRLRWSAVPAEPAEPVPGTGDETE